MAEPTLEDLAAQFPGPSARLESVLSEMAEEVEGLRALVIGDRNGLPVASIVRSPKALATTAMATLTLSAATKVTTSLALPDADNILIEAGGWRVIVQHLGNGFTLTGVFAATENLGLVKLAMRARGREIWDLLDEMA